MVFSPIYSIRLIRPCHILLISNRPHFYLGSTSWFEVYDLSWWSASNVAYVRVHNPGLFWIHMGIFVSLSICPSDDQRSIEVPWLSIACSPWRWISSTPNHHVVRMEHTGPPCTSCRRLYSHRVEYPSKNAPYQFGFLGTTGVAYPTIKLFLLITGCQDLEIDFCCYFRRW